MDKPISRRKQLLCSLTAYCSNEKTKDFYRKYLMDAKKMMDEEEEKQEKTEKQTENWESWDTILKVYHQLEREATPLFHKDVLNPANMKLIQQYILLSMFVHVPPRRIMDYTHFKVKNIDEEKDNYVDFDKKELVFNTYKTSKHYGRQMVDCPDELMAILKKWEPIASHYSEYLLFNGYGNPMSQPQMTKMMNHIFNKKISASMLRHIFISDVVLKNVPPLTELTKMATNMGHSVREQMLYKKV
jgi:integrase